MSVRTEHNALAPRKKLTCQKLVQLDPCRRGCFSTLYQAMALCVGNHRILHVAG